MRAVILAIVGSCLGAFPALAQDSENGRYAMTPVEGGFMRLDTRTGGVALCKPSGDSVQCRATPNERDALQSEIDRLAKENAELKSRLAGAPQAPAARSRAQEELDRALDYAERFMRRMMRVFREEAPQGDRT